MGVPRKGVCSTFFADRVGPDTKVPVFVHKSPSFKLPADGSKPIIMVGPGTGIAPFERFSKSAGPSAASGRNWLFFGDQKAASDFLYREELEAMQEDGFLTRLDTAFSRDQAEKIYVQDRMIENASEIWSWLQEGGYFYVCGDAKRMAKDVDAALHKIAETAGSLSAEQAGGLRQTAEVREAISARCVLSVTSDGFCPGLHASPRADFGVSSKIFRCVISATTRVRRDAGRETRDSCAPGPQGVAHVIGKAMTITSIKEIAGAPLSEEQTTYLTGFFAGVEQRAVVFADFLSSHEEISARAVKAGDETEEEVVLTAEERMKNEEHPLDSYYRLLENAQTNKAPDKEDTYRFKWNGLFYLAPVKDAFMARLRIPGGIVKTYQLRGLAQTAKDLTTGYCQITTRANLQVRLIQPKDAPAVLRRIQAIGLHTRGTGADNIRNLTSNPTAGIDPREVIDCTPYVQELADFILSHREFYNLPRKFNIAFDGGGLIGSVEDTNDIGAKAVTDRRRCFFPSFTWWCDWAQIVRARPRRDRSRRRTWSR